MLCQLSYTRKHLFAATSKPPLLRIHTEYTFRSDNAQPIPAPGVNFMRILPPPPPLPKDSPCQPLPIAIDRPMLRRFAFSDSGVNLLNVFLASS